MTAPKHDPAEIERLVADAKRELADGFKWKAPSAWVYEKHINALCAALLAEKRRADEDAARLLIVAGMMDGIGKYDLHEDAAQSAHNAGRDEPIAQDYLNAVRIGLDALAEGKGEVV